MSRSVKKHSIVKYNWASSWKKDKTLLHRKNRARAKNSMRHGEENMEKDLNLNSLDFDYCKWYYGTDDPVYRAKARRK